MHSEVTFTGSPLQVTYWAFFIITWSKEYAIKHFNLNFFAPGIFLDSFYVYALPEFHLFLFSVGISLNFIKGYPSLRKINLTSVIRRSLEVFLLFILSCTICIRWKNLLKIELNHSLVVIKQIFFITFPIFEGFQRKVLYKLSQILDTI